MTLSGAVQKPKIQALVIDCLRIDAHMSHFGLGQAVATARRMGAEKTYLVRPSPLPHSSSPN